MPSIVRFKIDTSASLGYKTDPGGPFVLYADYFEMVQDLHRANAKVIKLQKLQEAVAVMVNSVTPIE